MNKQLSIIIFDGSLKTTTFINRLAEGLALNHNVYILGYSDNLKSPVVNVNYVALGSSHSKIKFVATTLSFVLKFSNLHLLPSTILKFFAGERKGLREQNLELAIKQIEPDIIHLQWPGLIISFKSIINDRKIPVILSQRGYHNNVRPFLDQKNFKFLTEWYPKLAGFHSVSRAISENGDKIWYSDEKIDHIVYTGLPIKRILMKNYFEFSNPIQLLSIGRPHWIKGYSYALKACVLLKDKNLLFHYTIIGAAENEELLYLINDLKLNEYITLTSSLSQTDVMNFMKNSSLLIMPSLEEGLPNVVVEAMALGLPVLSTNCGGVPEIINDGIEGWLVPTRDPTALADAVIKFVELPIEKIKEITNAARLKVELQHTEQKMINDMENLYYTAIKAYKKVK